MKTFLVLLLATMFLMAPVSSLAEAEVTVTIISPENEVVQQAEPVAEAVIPYEKPTITPAYSSVNPCTHENCYWSTPMDITNEEAVWKMLMAPITVVKGDQKTQVKLRKEPSEDSEGVADVTCFSQGVHVIKNLDSGWSLVEVYSSSFYDSKIKAWNQFTQGYIKTNLLEEKQVGNTEYAMVMDKLDQRLYIFKDGELFTELLASTGLPNEKQPYNETRSGEFLLVSAVGQFASDSLLCNYAIRFNFGDLIHEVPHLPNADGSPNYKRTEPELGKRASHGCIRIQRLKNADGVNMRWIWNEMYKGVAKKPIKFIIWEDYQGRQLPIPAKDTPLYYNDKGGKNYHLRETCNGVKDDYLPLTGFTYGEIDDTPYASLTPCNYCNPPLHPSDIQKVNEQYQKTES